MGFPERVYTGKELNAAKSLVDQGYRHQLTVDGKPEFIQKVEKAIEYIKTAGYYDYLQTYIKFITEIDGMTQLRQSEVAIWANKFAVGNPVDAASLFIQKAYSMQEYLEGKLYYGGAAEKRSIAKRIEFLQTLKEKTTDESVKEECARLLGLWHDSSL
ncbi:MAG: transmembrane 9 family protein [Crenarchaeota archaeon]|nr:transmembrane 9 family protein [Thermoproteota archaeon]